MSEQIQIKKQYRQQKEVAIVELPTEVNNRSVDVSDLAAFVLLEVEQVLDDCSAAA